MTVLQNAEARRPRGRPQVRSDEETLRLVVEAAAREFMVNGYGGACVGAVAIAAGVSTRTLYRLVPTKADLFIKVVNDRIGRFMDAFELDGGEPDDIEEELARILTAYGRFMLQDETIAVNRLVVSESDRFPEIAAGFYRMAVLRTNAALADWLAMQCERGLLRLRDPEVAAGMLRGMMIMEPQRATMLGQRTAPEAGEIAERARRCANLFLNGCRARDPNPPSDPR